jgi:Kef-type K+ transport system membrane component KefB
MWKKRYKKTFIPTQFVVVGICVVLRVMYKMPLLGILTYFVVMEIGALVGAMWTTRLLGKFERRDRDHVDLTTL